MAVRLRMVRLMIEQKLQSSRMINRRTRSLAAFFAGAAMAVVASSLPTDALGYTLPEEPSAPKSQAECDVLYQRYMEIFDALRDKSAHKFEEAAPLFDAGRQSEARALQQEGGSYLDEAQDVGAQRDHAVKRCRQLAERHEPDRRRLIAEVEYGHSITRFVVESNASGYRMLFESTKAGSSENELSRVNFEFIMHQFRQLPPGGAGLTFADCYRNSMKFELQSAGEVQRKRSCASGRGSTPEHTRFVNLLVLAR